ncbi:aminopeptidase O-like [Haliotis rubra]|uniref:aminopeptidase O-like n=1 Tax=Haliotis rubra TaxID=36100 RepID=UPI001EE506F1|nr:aminopeptidase O-like [Haliotis rubra]
MSEHGEGGSDHELDLPLSANICDVRVSHFLLHLKCDVESRKLSGDITLFYQQESFKLDCKRKTVLQADTELKAVETSCESHSQLQANTDPSPSSVHDPALNELCQHECVCKETEDCSKTKNIHNDDCVVDQPSSSIHSRSTLAQCSDQNVLQSVSASTETETKNSSLNIPSPSQDAVKMVLDAYNLDVTCAEELILSPDLERKLFFAKRDDVESASGIYMQCYMQSKTRPLQFSVSKQSIRLWGGGGDMDEDCQSRTGPGESRLRHLQGDVISEGELQPTDSDASLESGADGGGLACKRTWEGDKVDAAHHVSDGGEGHIHTDEGVARVVRIHYSTEGGPSLKWSLDQDGRECMFTVGHWLNNRSWFPSQDAPTAMSTWQACVTVKEGLTVLMTGDKSCTPSVSQGWKTYYYYSTMPMPTSTLAIAVGTWTQVDVVLEQDVQKSSQSACTSHGPTCPVNYAVGPEVPCRVFVSECMVPLVQQELAVYVPRCLREVYAILGPHPFQRLDILVVPCCFDSLGMASPSLLVLSQSVLVGDNSMCFRVAHEICHSWFGLLIGPQDWTEEWLTEGFCTYLEDIIHARVCQWGEAEIRNRLELRVLLKQKTLLAEVENTEQDLQMLRPNKGEQLLAATEEVQYVKNGMNPDKAFMQVHYLKGFFLLRHLQNKVGLTEFLIFLRHYVDQFHAKLVTSKDFFQFFINEFPELRTEGLSEQQLTAEWLDCPHLPQDVSEYCPSQENILYRAVKTQVALVESHCQGMAHCHRKKKQKVSPTELTLQKLDPDQLVLFLENLLQLNLISGNVLDLVHRIYLLSSANPDVRHRWCELVIKHRHASGFGDVKTFLLNDQAMGVYLYGEMMLSKCKKLKELAYHCFNLVRQDMPEGAHKTVHAMLYGT